jgi:hypothetical protein
MKSLHSAFRIPHSALALLLAVMLYSSCTEVADPMNPNGLGQPVEELREQARQEAMAAWEKFKAENNLEYRDGGSSSGGGSTTRDPIPCECTYVIEEVSYQLPDGQTEVGMEFFTPSILCDPSNPFSCSLFSSLYFSDTPCGGFINPACEDFWDDLPPLGHNLFNCPAPGGSTFLTSFAGYWYNPISCNGGELESWEIKFKIYCQQSEPDPNCLYGLGYGFVSELITLSSSVEDPFTDDVIIQLQDCGCSPVVID